MGHTPTLENVEQLVRARICAVCPYRTPGADAPGTDFSRRCESSCSLFVHLPLLRETVRQLDPMVGHPARSLARILDTISRPGGRHTGAARRYGNHVVQLLQELFV